MQTFLYDGHVVDVHTTCYGRVAYVDHDMEPLDITEEEYENLVKNQSNLQTN